VIRLLDRARGDWHPATRAPVLLVVQLLLLWQVGLRGLDYVRAGSAPALDAGVASPLLGWVLYAAAILVLAGLAVGTFVLWQRDRLTRRLDDLLAEEDPECLTC
jgi:small-conductance mechanosensitive channel